MRALRDSGLLEHVRGVACAQLSAEAGVAIEAAECGQANAFWSREDHTVTLCYELLQDYEELARRAVASRE